MQIGSHMDFLQNFHVLFRLPVLPLISETLAVPFHFWAVLLFKSSYSTAMGSTSTATCTSFGSLVALIVPRIALVSDRICLPRATTW